MMQRYRSVLAVEGCARVLATALVGRLPQGMSSLAILLVVRQATHSYAAAGLATGGYALANALAAPTQGRLVDRVGAARVLVPCALAQACLLVSLILAAHGRLAAVGLVALATGAGALQPALAPTVRALLQEMIVDPGARETAYAVESVTQELIWITGPLVVAVLIAVVSPSGALVASCLVCIAGTSLFVSSPSARRDPSRSACPSRSRGAIRANPQLRALMAPMALMGMGIGAIDVGLPSLALHAGSRPSSGLLLAMWSIGSLGGGLIYGSRSWRLSLPDRHRRLLIAAVLCSAPLIAARTIPEGLVLSLLAGVTIAPVFSCQYALAGRLVTAGGATEAFTWVAAALVTGVAAGSALGGTLISAGGVSAPFAVACAALAIAALSAVRVRIAAPVLG